MSFISENVRFIQLEQPIPESYQLSLPDIFLYFSHLLICYVFYLLIDMSTCLINIDHTNVTIIIRHDDVSIMRWNTLQEDWYRVINIYQTWRHISPLVTCSILIDIASCLIIIVPWMSNLRTNWDIRKNSWRICVWDLRASFTSYLL